MSTLAAFLSKRLDEEEKALVDYCRGAAVTVTIATTTHRVLKVDDRLAERVLADINSKRRLVKWVFDWPLRPSRPSSVDGVLELLALPYADHAEYDERWRV